MISAAVIEALKGYVPEENISLQEKMAGHTTFRIGGPADCFLQLESEEQLQKVQKYLNLVEESYFILGNGSNLLVSDSGYQGIILQIGSKMSHIQVSGNTIIAQAGAPLSQSCRAGVCSRNPRYSGRRRGDERRRLRRRDEPGRDDGAGS